MCLFYLDSNHTKVNLEKKRGRREERDSCVRGNIEFRSILLTLCSFETRDTEERLNRDCRLDFGLCLHCSFVLCRVSLDSPNGFVSFGSVSFAASSSAPGQFAPPSNTRLTGKLQRQRHRCFSRQNFLHQKKTERRIRGRRDPEPGIVTDISSHHHHLPCSSCFSFKQFS